MEMKELSIKELIDTARGCAGDFADNACVECAFRGGEGDCTGALLLALADKLEGLNDVASAVNTEQSQRLCSPNCLGNSTHQSPTATASHQGEAFEDEYRLTARENGHAYFMKCFEEPCAGAGCKFENCEFIKAVCEKLCKYEEGARAYGIEWIPCKLAKPAEADEYLVMVAGAKKPTVLFYDPDEEIFYEEYGDEVFEYPVTYWAELPEAPETAGASPRPTVEEGKEPVKRCATCKYEDRMAEEERCIECEKHSLWEERK